MKRIIQLWALVFCCNGGVWAQIEQQWAIAWDSVYNLGGSETMNDLIYLQDGRIAAVGHSVGNDAKVSGFFLLLDASTGMRITYKTYPTLSNNYLNGVAYAGDGTFYLVGYQDTENMGQQAWWLRIEEDGAMIHDEVIGAKGDDRFEKIEWLKHSGLIVGHSDKFVDNEMWVLKTDGSKVEEVRSVGDGLVSKIIGTELGKDVVWVVAYAAKSKRTRENDILIFQLQSNGALKGAETIPAKNGQEVYSMSVTEYGELMLGGAIWGTVGSDTWMARVLPKGSYVEIPSLNYDGKDFGAALHNTPGNKKLMVVKWPTSKRLSVVAFFEDNMNERMVFDLPRYEDFNVLKLLYLKKNTYLLAGCNLTKGNKKNANRLMCLYDTERIPAGRGLPQLEYSDLMFDDDTNDGYLSPGERASIRVKISNSAKSEAPVQEGTVKVVVASPPVAGLTVQQTEMTLGFMPAGEGKDFAFFVKADKSAKITKVNIEILVEINGKTYLKIPYFFEGVPQKPAPPIAATAGTNVFITDPDPGQSRVVVAKTKDQTIKAKGYSPNGELKSNDFQRGMNGKTLKDERSVASFSKLQKSYRFEYTLEYNVQLEPGRNEFYVNIEGGLGDTIVFDYTPEKPNLYILSIGVPYDLKYPAKDALDFARSMNSAFNREYFNLIEIDTLVSKNNTDRNSILEAFLKMSQRAGNIKPDDYLMVFVAGHGIIRAKDRAFGLVPADYRPLLPSETSVNLEEMIRNHINPIECKKFIFMDACHSGSGAGAARDLVDPKVAKKQQEASQIIAGAVTFASCDSTQLSYEDELWGNGAFTRALIEAFSGKTITLTSGEQINADMGLNPNAKVDDTRNDGFIAVGELKNFLAKRVPDLVKTKFDKNQTPVTQMRFPMQDNVTIFHYKKQ